MKFYVRAFLLSTIAILTSSCQKYYCGIYDEIIKDKKKNADLVRWADEQIFSRKFSKKDWTYTEFVGPGRRGENIDIIKSGILMPDWLNGYVIRSIGPNPQEPDFIFVGKRRFQGFIISRKEFSSDTIPESNISISSLENKTSRVAMICFTDND